MLAGKGVASSVGLVPGNLQDKENTIIKLAELLEVDIDVIKNKLSAEWVKDDSFVPIKTIPKVSELELMKINPDENLVKLKENQEELLSIPGVMINIWLDIFKKLQRKIWKRIKGKVMIPIVL